MSKAPASRSTSASSIANTPWACEPDERDSLLRRRSCSTQDARDPRQQPHGRARSRRGARRAQPRARTAAAARRRPNAAIANWRAPSARCSAASTICSIAARPDRTRTPHVETACTIRERISRPQLNRTHASTDERTFAFRPRRYTSPASSAVSTACANIRLVPYKTTRGCSGDRVCKSASSGKPEGRQAFPLEPRVQGRFARIVTAEDVLFRMSALLRDTLRARTARSAAARFPRPSASPPPNASPNACSRLPLRTAVRPRRRLLGDGRRDRAARAGSCACRAAARLLPARAARRRRAALRAVAPGRCRWSSNRYGIPEPDVPEPRCCPPRRWRSSSRRWSAFDARGHRLGMGGGWYDRSFAFRRDASPRRRWLVGAAFAVAASRRVSPAAVGRAARCVCSEARHASLPIAVHCPMSRTPPLLADEVRTRRVLDRRSRARAASNPGTACATTRRATTCATACSRATACCSTTPAAAVPGIAGLGEGRQRGVSGSDAVRSSKSRLLRPEEHARRTALVAGRRGVRAQVRRA